MEINGYRFYISDSGGKAGKGENVTGSIQIRKGNVIAKQFCFRIGNKGSRDRALAQARAWARASIILILCLLLAGCDTPTITHPSNRSDVRELDADIEVCTIEIEGCEYLVFSWYPGSTAGLLSITHKGNCKNSIHRHLRAEQE